MKKDEIKEGMVFEDWTALGAVGADRKVPVRCVCGNEKRVAYYSLLNGDSKGCGCKSRLRARQKRIDNGDFEDLTGKIFGKWQVLKKGIGANRYLCQCSGCSLEKEIFAGSLIKGKSRSCNKCGTQNYKKTMKEKYGEEHPLRLEEFKEKQQNTILKMYGVKNVSQNEEVKKKIEKTNIERYGVPNPMQNEEIKEKVRITTQEVYGHDCYFKTDEHLRNLDKLKKHGSEGQKEVKDFLISLGFSNITKRYLRYKEKIFEIDIKPEDIDIAIEYNGNYWHSESNPNIYPSYHKDKTKAAKLYGFRLIHIFEHEWKNKKEQVKSYLRSAFNKNEIKIGARETECKEIEDKNAVLFLEKYHIQGAGRKDHCFGLFYNNDLVAVSTFSRHHRNSKDIVMSRWCCKENITISGGLSKIIQSAMQQLQIERIITWADLRFSDGQGYLKSGWKLEKELKPDYFYYSSNKHCVVSKQSRKKSNVGTPKGMTEHEHALKDGLYRTWDCGKLRFSFTKNLLKETGRTI